jgi:hypothetical protein
MSRLEELQSALESSTSARDEAYNKVRIHNTGTSVWVALCNRCNELERLIREEQAKS